MFLEGMSYVVSICKKSSAGDDNGPNVIPSELYLVDLGESKPSSFLEIKKSLASRNRMDTLRLEDTLGSRTCAWTLPMLLKAVFPPRPPNMVHREGMRLRAWVGVDSRARCEWSSCKAICYKSEKPVRLIRVRDDVRGGLAEDLHDVQIVARISLICHM